MKFEMVWLGLTCACVNYSAREARLLGGSGDYLDYRPFEIAIFE